MQDYSYVIKPIGLTLNSIDSIQMIAVTHHACRAADSAKADVILAYRLFPAVFGPVQAAATRILFP